jgi:predicted ATP-grasp superfamily ATP-dependent carboligase
VRSNQPKILLSEGSSLSAREAITALGLAGHRVEIASCESRCLGRFSRFVDRVHPVPASGTDPDAYLAAILDIVKRRGIDVLLPVHEQAYLFAAARARLPADVGIALAEFAAFEQVQSKARLAELLTRLDVPQPDTMMIHNADDFARPRPTPFFVKAAFGTASVGVWRVADAQAHEALSAQLAQRQAFAAGIVVQAAVTGALERSQAVFDRGRLVALHIYRQIAEGPGGGDVLKLSVVDPEVRAIVGTIGHALTWHGALSFDYIRDHAGTPRFIDANPRLVEPMNAWLSGVDLPGALLKISRGKNPPTQPDGRAGVLTRLGLMGLLDAARRRQCRRDVLAELFLLATGSGRYRSAREELLPLGRDPLCALPLAIVIAKLLVNPASSAQLAGGTIAAYSLTPEAIQRLHAWQQSG